VLTSTACFPCKSGNPSVSNHANALSASDTAGAVATCPPANKPEQQISTDKTQTVDIAARFINTLQARFASIFSFDA
jgi:hypothetical protein